MIKSLIKESFNYLLKPLSVRIDTYTAHYQEQSRIHDAKEQGRFNGAAYYTPKCIENFDAEFAISAYKSYGADMDRFFSGERNSTGYYPNNGHFETPDAQILYLFIRSLMPKRIIEIGCGSSTRIIKQAMIDGNIDTDLICIDPSPRVEIAGLPNRLIQCRVEDSAARQVFSELRRGDVLFIDSSHELIMANDCAHLFCNVIPRLDPGVIVHVHDVFIPYEYPFEWAASGWRWGEQYALHALLVGCSPQVLWPGYYAQVEMAWLGDRLPFLSLGRAQSFWMRWQGLQT